MNDRCREPEEKAALISKRKDCTAVLAELRKDIKTARRLIEDNPKIKRISASRSGCGRKFTLRKNKEREITNDDKEKIRFYFTDLG